MPVLLSQAHPGLGPIFGGMSTVLSSLHVAFIVLLRTTESGV